MPIARSLATKLTLDNSLCLAMQPGPGEVTALAVRIMAGAQQDPEDRLGLANLIAEVLPTGTVKHNNRWLTERFDFLGVLRSTWATIEHLNFSATFLPQHLDEVLALASEIFLQPSFPSREMETARARALQELQAIEDEPRQKIFRILSEAYLGPKLGREVLGRRETLPYIARKDALAQHMKAFNPQSTIIAVGGKFDQKAVHRTIKNKFGKWKSSCHGGQASSSFSSSITPPPPTSRVVHQPKESDQEQIAIAFPSVSRADADYYVARVIAAILSGGMSARLFTEVREKRGLVYAVSAWHSYMKGFGYFASYAGTTAARSQETLEVLCAELKRAGTGVTRDELQQAKVGLKSKLIIRSEQPGAQAGRILDDLTYLGRITTMEEVAHAIDAVSRSRIENFAQKHPPHPLTVATLGPKKLTPPTL